MSRAPSLVHDLNKQMEAAKVLRAQLLDLADGDEEFVRDTLEGETNLHEMICEVIADIVTDDALEAGIAKLIEDLKTRKIRIGHRSDTKRTMVANAMEIAGLPRIETPAGTVSSKATPPKLVVVEESEIPTRFYVTPAPSLDRSALTKALRERAAAIAKAGEIKDETARTTAIVAAETEFPMIPGAILGNGGKTIQLRIK